MPLRLEGEKLSKFRKELEKNYALQLDYPIKDLDELKLHLNNIARRHKLILEEDEKNPNKLLIGHKTFADLPPPIVGNYFLEILENNKEEDKNKYKVILIEDPMNRQRRRI